MWLHRKEDRKDCPVRNKHNVKKTGPCAVTAKSERSNAYTVVDEATGYRNQVHAKWLSPEGTYHNDADDAPYEDSSDDSELDDDASSSSEDDNDEAQIDIKNIVHAKRSRKRVDHGPFVHIADVDESRSSNSRRGECGWSSPNEES